MYTNHRRLGGHWFNFDFVRFIIFVGWDSSVGTVTRYRLDGPGIEPRWRGEIFRTRPDRSWGSPSLLYIGYLFTFSVVKRPGGGVDHPPTSTAEVKERVELYLYSPSGPSWPVIGWPLPLPLPLPLYVIFVLTYFRGSVLGFYTV